MDPVHVTELRVRYAETDQMGVVYHANYLAWCEVGRTEFVRAAGMSYREMEALGVGLAVSEASLRFHGSATYDDKVRVETRLTEVRSRALAFEYTIVNADTRARLVTAYTRLIAIDGEGRPTTLPQTVRGMLDGALDRSEASSTARGAS
ncbi:4-hydroxybenzoyl-CoA thioesterase [Gemmatimonadetes bacterium T265]|nr:4-hydroxybenzoyl-CoA thioesterase [Gemmatimonadetes bacterium T265]